MRGQRLETVVFCVFEIFRNPSSLGRRAEESETKNHPAARSLGVANDRQEVENTTGRERFEDSASV